MKDHRSNKDIDAVKSTRIKAGKRRVYYIDVKKTKNNEFYISMSENIKRPDEEGSDRHMIFLYKEEFNRFVDGLQKTVDYIKNELMPDYDFEEFDRRHEEWENRSGFDQ